VPVVDNANVHNFNLLPNGEELAIRVKDGVSIWNFRRRQPGASLPADGLNFSPDGKHFAVHKKNCIEIWGRRERKLVRKVHESDEPLDRVSDVELSSDGDTIAVLCQEGLRLYSLSTGTEQVILPENFKVERYDNGGYGTSHSGHSTYGAQFSPDGKLLVAWGSYGLKVFNMSAGCTLLRTEPNLSISDLTFSPDGNIYATGDSNGTVALRDVATGKQIRSTVLSTPKVK
jgi:WD40 repeat protein